MKKNYYQMQMILRSPLRIGNGVNQVTDSDVMTDKRGLPFVPGSSIAGVLRDRVDQQYKESLFGYVDGEEIRESMVIVSDAVLPGDVIASDAEITSRDGVGLDDWGIAIRGSKYDFQVAECGRPFTCIMEADILDAEAEQALEQLLCEFVGNGIRLGARTTRGYGQFSVSVRKKVFVFPEQIEAWMRFDPYVDDAFKEGESLIGSGDTGHDMHIKIHFSIVGNVNVRVRSTDYEIQEDGTKPDSTMLVNAKGQPVIPGTAWAGAFRHHMRDLVRDCHLKQEEDVLKKVDRLFGKMAEQVDHLKSSITFSESEIFGGKDVTISRTALDRFTMTPRNAAVYTVRYLQGGSGSLEIVVAEKSLDPTQLQLLQIALMDLDLGLLPIGGEKGVGRGCVTIDEIEVNGTDCTGALKEQKLELAEVV